MTTRASNAKLSPGETSIDRVRLSTLNDGRTCINWTGRLAVDGALVRKRTFGKTVTEARRRAHRTWEKLNTQSADRQWDATQSMTRFITEVSRPHVEEIGGASATTKSAYLALDRLAGEFRSMTIGRATTAAALKAALRSIASEYGEKPAERARSVLNQHVTDLVVDLGIITHNPIRGIPIDLARVAKKSDKPRRGGHPLSIADLKRVTDHLHSIDPTTADAARPGPVTTARAIATRRNAVTTALIQFCTGLRIGETRQILWSDVDDRGDAGMIIHVRDEVAKNHRGRFIEVSDPRTVELLRERRLGMPEGSYVIGHIQDPMTEWPESTTQAKMADLFDELADDLDLPVLHTDRSHISRATLATALAAMGVNPKQSADALGQTVAVADKHYNKPAEATAVGKAAATLFADPK